MKTTKKRKRRKKRRKRMRKSPLLQRKAGYVFNYLYHISLKQA